ncbi:uncharacterized mitochondrial protein-like protein [Tanacetum coccineum]
MTHLLEKETPFVFSKDCIDAFETLKNKLTEAPILVVPDWNLPFELMCDARILRYWCGIRRQQKMKALSALHYDCLRTFGPKVKFLHYVARKEYACVVYALEKFRPHLVFFKAFSVVIQDPVQSIATTAPSTIPKAKGITFRDADERTTRTPTSVSSLSIKDKGKVKMDKLEVPLKKKDQIALDEEMARNLEAQLQAELIEEEMLARKKEKEANKALIESWNNTQAMMEAYFELELMNKRKKYFAKLRAEEKRRKPPTKAQMRNLMSTYLKNIGGYKYNQLKSKSYDEIQKLFDNEMKRDELEFDKSKKVESSEQKAKDSRKKSIDDHEEVEKDDEAKMKMHIEVVQDDEEIEIDAIPLATKPPIISISRKDLETLWKLVKTKYGNTSPEDDYKRVFWGDLQVMFEPYIKSEIWRSLQGYKVTVWKLFDSSGVHFVRFQNLHIFITAGTKVNAAGLQLLEDLLLSEG